MSNKLIRGSTSSKRDIDDVLMREGLTITNEEVVDELLPPDAFSEDERISILADFTGLAINFQTNAELYEGCIQKIFDVIPNVERATILMELGGELFPVKYVPREQAFYSETFVKETRDRRTAFSWLRKTAKSKIPKSTFDAVAAMYVPMIKDRNVIGVLHVDSKSRIDGFTKPELDTLSVIANILALSIKSTLTEQVVPSVFISYSHKNTNFAKKLKGDLRRNGISVWIDERLKAADEAWLKQLAVAIQKQDYFLYLITPDSEVSKYCEWELNTAQSFNKTIVPLMVKNAVMPITISGLQFIDFRQGYTDGLSMLLQTIHRRN